MFANVAPLLLVVCCSVGRTDKIGGRQRARPTAHLWYGDAPATQHGGCALNDERRKTTSGSTEQDTCDRVWCNDAAGRGRATSITSPGNFARAGRWSEDPHLEANRRIRVDASVFRRRLRAIVSESTDPTGRPVC